MSALLIVNPFASGVDEHRVAAVSAALPADTETTDHARRRGHRIATVAPDVDTIYVFGGDGTYNEVLNGRGRGPLGFIPGGGTSVFHGRSGSRATPSRRREARAWRDTNDHGRSGQRAPLRVQRGIGFDAELSARSTGSGAAPTGGVRVTARSAGLMSGRSVATGGSTRSEIEGFGRAAFCLVANCSPYTYAGAVGLDLVPGAGFDEGLAMFAPTRVGRELPRLAAAAFGGGRRPGRHPSRAISTAHGPLRPPLPLQVDGEDVGDVEQRSTRPSVTP